MIPWWAWAVLSAALALAELHVPGSYLIWIAVGAALTAAIEAAAGSFSIPAQIGIFAGASAISCVGGYFVYRTNGMARRRRNVAPLNERNLSMVGSRGVVAERLVAGRGKVRLGDSVWLAEGPDLEVGTSVRVKSVLGTRVLVEEYPPQAPGGTRGAAAPGGTTACGPQAPPALE